MALADILFVRFSDIFTTQSAGVVPVSPGGTGLFLRSDGTWQSVTGSLAINSTGITGGSSGNVLYDNAGVLGGFGTWDGTTLDIDGQTNSLKFASATTGNSPSINAYGGDTNVGLSINLQGSGQFLLNSGGGTVLAVDVGGGSANQVSIISAQSGAAPIIAATGSDTNVGLTLRAKGSSSITMQANGGTDIAIFNNPASAANFFNFSAAQTAGAPTVGVFGGDANISLNLGTKNTGVLLLNSVQFATTPPGGTTQFLRGDGTWAAPFTAAALTEVNDTNVTLSLGGTPSTALLQAASITAGWTGTLAVARGGTGGGTASGTLLDNITGFSSTGYLKRTGAGAYSFVSDPSDVTSVSNSDGTLTISPTTGAVVASLALSHANTWSGTQSFNSGKLAFNGSSSGSTTVNASATASGTLTLPAATDTLVARATTDTLTNKTISSSTNTIGTGTVLEGVTMTLGSDATGDIYYRNSSGVLTRLAIGGAGTFLAGGGSVPAYSTPSYPTGANPTATAADVAVNGVATTFMRSDAAPAVQKASASQFGIVEVDGTTITASGGVITAVGGGGGGVSSVTNSDGTLTISPTTGAVVASLNLGNANTWTAAQSFNSGKLVLNGSTSGSTTLNASATASGTLTLPAATDTLVGRATTDTLTNKTISSSTNTVGSGTVLGGVTMTLGSDATGDIYYRSSGGVLTRLAIGGSNTFLAGGGSIPAYSQPAFSNLSGNISVSQMNSGTGASSSTFWRGDGTWATPSGGGGGGPISGRLTLTSGTPVMTSTTSAQTTVYFTPYKGNTIPVWNGSTFTSTTFTEMSQATTDTTKSPAAVGATKVYDVFVWSDSGTLRATRGPAWSSNTSRGTGSGTTQLQLVDGIWVNEFAITNGPGAGAGTYVGTIASDASSEIDWILGAAASGGTAAVLNVWNYYNRVYVSTTVVDNGTSYNNSSSTIREARGSTGNQVTFVQGMQEDSWTAVYTANTKTAAGSGVGMAIGIGLNTTTAYSGASEVEYLNNSTTATNVALVSNLTGSSLGLNVISANESAPFAGTNQSNLLTNNNITFDLLM